MVTKATVQRMIDTIWDSELAVPKVVKLIAQYPHQVGVDALTRNGLFMALQTLRHTLPEDVFQANSLRAALPWNHPEASAWKALVDELARRFHHPWPIFQELNYATPVGVIAKYELGLTSRGIRKLGDLEAARKPFEVVSATVDTPFARNIGAGDAYAVKYGSLVLARIRAGYEGGLPFPTDAWLVTREDLTIINHPSLQDLPGVMYYLGRYQQALEVRELESLAIALSLLHRG